MASFRCYNDKCGEKGKKVDILDFDWPYITQAERTKQILCKECGEKMECIPFEELRGIKGGSVPAHNKFGSLTDGEKKKILKKRADRAYQKDGGAEKKQETKRKAIKDYLKGGR